MNSQRLAKKKLPDAPGVYFFLGRNKKILYIGKATSLRSRVRSYFAPDIAEKRSQLIKLMVDEATGVDFKRTDSVLEALILEADLIKKFQPKYNTDEKDGKSFNCVGITDENFPRVLIIRKKDVDFSSLKTANRKLQTVFGPFPQGSMLKNALKIIRQIFPYRDDKCVSCVEQQRPSKNHSNVLENTRTCKPCFNRQIGLCPGVCTGEVSQKEYGKTVRNIKLFLSGKKNRILKSLKRDMAVAARALEFERAAEIKKTIFALKHIQDVSLIRTDNQKPTTNNYRIEAYDVAHLSGTDVVGVMTVVENGLPKKSDYKKFKIRGRFGNNDIASLKEVLERRLRHVEWPMPNLMVADGGIAQKNVLETALKEKGLSIAAVAVTKNDRHAPDKILGDESIARLHKRAILFSNAEAHRFAVAFHRKRRGLGIAP